MGGGIIQAVVCGKIKDIYCICWDICLLQDGDGMRLE